MLFFPNAKINIGLFVTEKRNDGYHNLETIFYPIAVNDVLEIIPNSTKSNTDLYCYGMEIAGNKYDNLIWKAYQLLSHYFPEKLQSINIHLLKNIPMGAGLGGGSADGAFMLSALNRFFDLHLSTEQLTDYALQLGSDCPFFIYNQPAFAQGRGELLTPLDLDLSNYTIQLICPEIHISTATAFKGIQPKPAPYNLKNIAHLPLTTWQQYIHNDFEQSLFPAYPQLAKIKAQLLEQGALYASLSGTGATVYGIFPKNQSAQISLDTPYQSFLV